MNTLTFFTLRSETKDFKEVGVQSKFALNPSEKFTVILKCGGRNGVMNCFFMCERTYVYVLDFPKERESCV